MLQFKRAIGDAFDEEPDRLRVIFEKRVLKDEDYLSDIKIEEGAKVFVTIRQDKQVYIPSRQCEIYKLAKH